MGLRDTSASKNVLEIRAIWVDTPFNFNPTVAADIVQFCDIQSPVCSQSCINAEFPIAAEFLEPGQHNVALDPQIIHKFGKNPKQIKISLRISPHRYIFQNEEGGGGFMAVWGN